MTVVVERDFRKRLARDGYAIIENVFAPPMVAELVQGLSARPSDTSSRARAGSTYAVRNVISLVPRVVELIRSAGVRDILAPIIGESGFAVRGILFDKTPDANWKVAWHQDLSIAVKDRVEASGFGPWSVKAGVQHVQPPVQVLREMVTLRVHLDDCGETNGALRVIPGSHARGILGRDEVEAMPRTRAHVACTGSSGSVVLMSPLILHASSSATAPGHRRVLHIEFASRDLPGELQWFERVNLR